MVSSSSIPLLVEVKLLTKIESGENGFPVKFILLWSILTKSKIIWFIWRVELTLLVKFFLSSIWGLESQMHILLLPNWRGWAAINFVHFYYYNIIKLFFLNYFLFWGEFHWTHWARGISSPENLLFSCLFGSG